MECDLKELRQKYDYLKRSHNRLGDIRNRLAKENEDLKQRLLATGDKRLVEGNTWGDTFWGVDLRSGRGENQLGRILMRVREELKENADS